MRVSKTDTICNLPAPLARQLMRIYFDDHTIEAACDLLDLDQNAARESLSEFELIGYLERIEKFDQERWITTIRGNALAQASFGRPITRVTATRHLEQVIERARSYNADTSRLLTVTQIIVFGSYLDPAISFLGDLDLAISAVRRDTNGQRYIDKVLEYTHASGRRFDMFHERLFWPLRELRMILKNRSSAISITDEDVSKITDRFKVVYNVAEDPNAIPPPPDAAPQR